MSEGWRERLAKSIDADTERAWISQLRLAWKVFGPEDVLMRVLDEQGDSERATRTLEITARTGGAFWTTNDPEPRPISDMYAPPSVPGGEG